jgi:hypothetical protein
MSARTARRDTKKPEQRPVVPNRTRVRIPKAAELVSKTLRSQIVRGELPEGESLAPRRS